MAIDPVEPTIERPAGLPMYGPDFAVDGQLLYALGSLIREASHVEYQLRVLYCALVDSKYAAVTAAGQTTAWLRDNSLAVAKARPDLQGTAFEALKDLLDRTKVAFEKRNRYVHDIWALGATEPELWRSKRGTFEFERTAVVLSELIELVRECGLVGVLLMSWTASELGDAITMESALRIESRTEDDGTQGDAR